MGGVSKSFLESDRDTQAFISKLLSVFSITCAEFEYRWIKQNKIFELYLLDRDDVLMLRDRYLELTQNQNYINSKDHLPISNVPQTHISFEFSFVCDCDEKTDNNKSSILLSGVQYLVDENNTKLKGYITDVVEALGHSVTTNDFLVRRINKSDTCIVTFSNFILCNNIFRSYLDIVRRESSIGIPKSLLKTTPCVDHLTINEQLDYSSRVLYSFCRQFKRNGIISNVSTRKGKVVIKLNESDKWTLVKSYDELKSIIKIKKDVSSLRNT